ncbi:Coenzyme F420 hydrogenase/dehydrogenase, beta subunit C-terminal domain [Bacteroides congonensis]
MITITDKSKCCGCSACVQRCPKQCIAMVEDKEGFLYPEVDANRCINCGLCEKVCPVIHQDDREEPLEVFAALNPNEDIRMKSSSGGVFTQLAEKVIEKGGVVFGARFNRQWEVVHDYVEAKEEIGMFRGSKYVQSRIDNDYKEVERFLKEGRYVLFSGTPCQIAGLRGFLGKDYDNLLLVDFICHGVPSPGVFRTFLRDEIDKYARKGVGKNSVLLPCIPLVSERDGIDFKGLDVKSISFRDKRNGWKKFSFVLVFSKVSAAGDKNSVLLSYTPLHENLYLRGFLKDLYLRPTCHFCPAKHLSSGSDITLGDYWGIASTMPELDDDKGISAVTVNTEKGRVAIHSTDAQLRPASWTDLLVHNSALQNSVPIPPQRELFFRSDGKTFEEKIRVLCSEPVTVRRFIKKILKKLHLA